MSTMANHASLFILISCFFTYCISKPTIHPHRKTQNKTLPTYIPIYPKPNSKLMNKIDSCWRSDPNWSLNRKALANCAIGFGSGAIGGKNGAIYVVKDSSDNSTNPKPGTLRYGVVQTEPLWIIFKSDMIIILENELMVSSYKTIDGRGARVEISNGPCITIQSVSHVIVHGLSIHDCGSRKPAFVRTSKDFNGHRFGSVGDAITILRSSNVWIDHCYFARCKDGLVDVTHASNLVTISNNYFTQQNKVMLLGHMDNYTADKTMKVTVVFNHFGPGLVQRMPRVRHGYAHVANNRYDEWLMYAIGGSADPTILSEGNYFQPSNDPYRKQVTKRETGNNWMRWKWKSEKDVFINGAYFVASGYGNVTPNYSSSQKFVAEVGSMAPALTFDAGPLFCLPPHLC